MRVFVTRWFGRFARKERVSEETLLDAVRRAERGQVDANLGGGVIKQRVARRGRGRSGGYRMIVLYRSRSRAIFAYGFAKSRKDDLDVDELEVYRELAKAYLDLADDTIDTHVASGALKEIIRNHDEDDEEEAAKVSK
jgi:hypothetical protein